MQTRINNLALVAHDNRKTALLDWLERNRDQLNDVHLITTGTTGRLVAERLALPVTRLKSGPLGGDQQIGARIAEGEVDMLIFFWDPLEPMSHDPDIKALLRLATLWNIPIACNESTADFLINAPLFQGYERRMPDFATHTHRAINPES